MRRRSPLSAVQMGLLSARCALIMVLVYLVIWVFHARFNALDPLHRTLFLSPALLSAAVSFWAQQRLRRGLRKGRWSPDEVEALRIRMNSRLWGAIGMVCLILGCVLLFRGPRFASPMVAFMFAFQMINAIGQAVRRKEDFMPSVLGDWQSSPKLQSQHWGER